MKKSLIAGKPLPSWKMISKESLRPISYHAKKKVWSPPSKTEQDSNVTAERECDTMKRRENRPRNPLVMAL